MITKRRIGRVVAKKKTGHEMKVRGKEGRGIRSEEGGEGKRGGGRGERRREG